MDLKSYKELSDVQKELAYQDEHIKEIFKLFILASGIEKIAYFNYDSKYMQYSYKYTLDSNDIAEDDISMISAKYSIELKFADIIFGKFAFHEQIKDGTLTKQLLKNLNNAFKKRHDIENKLSSYDSKINLFIITDQDTLKFAEKFKTNLNVLIEAKIKISSSVENIKDQLKEKNGRNVIIYTVKNELLIEEDKETLLSLNEFIIVIGPNNHNLSLICGKLNIQNYVSIEEYTPEGIKDIIANTKTQILNKNKHDNKIISLSGIAGGIGTTTIAMNIADLISQKNPEKNVLFIDLATTKAISNLFLGQNPLPEKTIINLVNITDFNINKCLENGMVKITENFYSVNGIQKHIDKDIIEQAIFIEKLLEFILKSSKTFNYIIIDTGEASASSLNSTIYDIVDEIWMVTQMNLPHISKLKTFYSLIKRAGLKDKLFFMVNRYNSQNAISVHDVESILNTSEEDNLDFKLKIPNDYENLGRCWNYCELVTRTAKDSIFVHKLEEILIKKDFITKETEVKVKKKSLFSFFSKDKK